MRDPVRIKRICSLLEEKWSKVPHQRLGQFLSNYIFGNIDIYYQEDNETEENLKGR